MTRKMIHTLAGIVIIGLIFSGCPLHKKEKQPVISLSQIRQIESFRPETASDQALEVINNNPYSQDFFEDVFARIVEQCKNSKAPENADIIWDHFIKPLRQCGKVPGDLAVATWNYYFSNHFASLPDTGSIENYCYKLPEIKKNMEKEYRMKVKGFEITNQGSPDSYFLNAMYVYNTMWAACNPSE